MCCMPSGLSAIREKNALLPGTAELEGLFSRSCASEVWAIPENEEIAARETHRHVRRGSS